MPKTIVGEDEIRNRAKLESFPALPYSANVLTDVFEDAKRLFLDYMIEVDYAQLRARLAKVGWISHGYVQDRGPGAGGPCYQWTRKVKAKTVSVALSQEQYLAMKQAIENWHAVKQTLERMQVLSRELIFQTLPNPPRRKRLTKKVLGLI